MKKTNDENLENVAGGASYSKGEEISKTLESWAKGRPKSKCVKCGSEYLTPDALVGTDPSWNYCGECRAKMKSLF